MISPTSSLFSDPGVTSKRCFCLASGESFWNVFHERLCPPSSHQARIHSREALPRSGNQQALPQWSPSRLQIEFFQGVADLAESCSASIELTLCLDTIGFQRSEANSLLFCRFDYAKGGHLIHDRPTHYWNVVSCSSGISLRYGSHLTRELRLCMPHRIGNVPR